MTSDDLTNVGSDDPDYPQPLEYPCNCTSDVGACVDGQADACVICQQPTVDDE